MYSNKCTAEHATHSTHVLSLFCLQDLDRTLSHAYPSTVLQERSSTTPGLKDSASQSNASTSTPQGQVDAAQELGEGKQREEWAWLFGEEGEMADKLRKAIAKMKKLDDKLTSVTKVRYKWCV